MFSERSFGASIFWFMLLLAFYLAPFVAADFYYIFGDSSCIFAAMQKVSIRLTLKQWLSIDAFTIIALITISFVSSIIACWTLTNKNPYLIYTISVSILGVWRTIWLSIGGVMFWGDLNQRKICSRSISDYMWSNLIIGFAGIPLYYIAGSCFLKV